MTSDATLIAELVKIKAALVEAQQIIGSLLGLRETVAADLRRLGSANDTHESVLKAREWYRDHSPEYTCHQHASGNVLTRDPIKS